MRSPARAALLAAALAATLAPRAARAECLGHASPRWVIQQQLVGLLNPLGTEHNARFGLCIPLYEADGPLTELNMIELGVSTYLSPVYFVPGAYVKITPVSFFYVRAEISGLTVWPIPLGGAGYYTRDSYEQSWNRDDLPVENGRSAAGWSARLMGVLRGRVDLAPGVGLLAFDAVWADINVLDRGDYWVDVRDDVIAANGDWVVANEGAILLEARPPDSPALRFGAYSALRSVPAAGYVGHHLGPICMVSWDRPDTLVGSIDLFVRLGVFTHHRFRREQATAMVGAAVDWDLGGL